MPPIRSPRIRVWSAEGLITLVACYVVRGTEFIARGEGATFQEALRALAAAIDRMAVGGTPERA